MFTIMQSEITQLSDVLEFYHSLIDLMDESPYHPGWVKNVYPNEDYLREAIIKGELYIGKTTDDIASCIVVNHECNEGYKEYNWPNSFEPEQINIIHAFGVHPYYVGQGLARQMLQYITVLSREERKKSIRLDVLSYNKPAKNLYESEGFKYISTLKMYYEDTGWTDFDLYEKLL